MILESVNYTSCKTETGASCKTSQVFISRVGHWYGPSHSLPAFDELFFATLQSKQHIAEEKKEIPPGTLTGHRDINNDKMVGKSKTVESRHVKKGNFREKKA